MVLNDIPLNTIDFSCYGQNSRLIGMVNVDLSELEFMTTEIKGAGIAGSIDWATRGHWNNATTTLHFRELYADSTYFMGQGQGHPLDLRGAYERYDPGTGERKVSGIRIALRGHANKFSLGKFEPGETMETELELTIDYIKVSVDGEVLMELDKFNFIYYVNGTDWLSEVRRILGR